MQRPRIAVAGSVNMDLVFGIAHLPQPGETLTGHAFHQIPGGKGANQAVAAARQGAAVSFIGCTGDDAFGQLLRDQLAAEGIDLSFLACEPAMASGIAAILLDDAGRNSIVLAPGANLAVSPAQLNSAAGLIWGADALVCQLEIPLATVRHAILLARQAGVPVVFNPAPMQALDDALLGMVDYLIVNETEAGQLSGIVVDSVTAASKAALAMLARGPAAVLLTMGAQGVVVARGAEVRVLAGLKVDVVDTTAAGDTFVGALAAALATGAGVFDAAAHAQYAAALAVTRLGAQSSIPHADEVSNFKLALPFT